MVAIAPMQTSLDAFLFELEQGSIQSLFQPIIDLRGGWPFAYEVLSRGVPPFSSPSLLFDRAAELGLTWELDRACRRAALQSIGALPADRREGIRFFLTVSPDSLDDERFVHGFTLAALREHGLAQTSIVIEITERSSIHDYARFETAIRHYAQQGFSIAVDDFGAGHSGLLTLISCVPHYLKLDMAVTRGIDRDPYKQMIVKSVVALAENIGAVLIAEGVETNEEVVTLVRYGVRFAQGFLFGAPAPALRA
jgi:EAL domain-containing protein (putative c-di-GMP-specific phosphodiesterase class I)